MTEEFLYDHEPLCQRTRFTIYHVTDIKKPAAEAGFLESKNQAIYLILASL